MDPRDVNTFLSAIEEMKKQGRLPRCADLDRRRFAHEIDEHFSYIGGWFGMICSILALKEASLHNQMEVSSLRLQSNSCLTKAVDRIVDGPE